MKVRTKRKNPKRFEIVEDRSLVVWLINPEKEAFYIKKVRSVICGDFGYHFEYKNLFTVFHIPTGSLIGALKDKNRARTAIKKLHLKASGLEDWKDMVSQILPLVRQFNILTYEEIANNIEYNDKEDVPF